MYSAGITARSMLHVSTKFDNLTLGLDVAGDLTAAAAAGAAILISRSSVVMETDTNLYPMSKSSWTFAYAYMQSIPTVIDHAIKPISPSLRAGEGKKKSPTW